MRTILPFIIVFLVLVHTAESQRIGNIWYFGFYCGITFDTPDGHPKAIDGNIIKMWEGCATISNDAGTVDLYTNGIEVYNKLNGLMSSQLAGGSSSSQSVIIVPKPGDSLIYYLFTTDAFENQQKNITKGLNYSIADMRANGGLGDIVQANVNLLKTTLEKVTFIKHRDTKSAWIIGHSYYTDEFYAFLLDAQGMHPPVISRAAPVVGDTTIGFEIRGDQGYLKASIDGKKIAAAYSQYSNVYLYDFDNSTGVVSNSNMLFPPTTALKFYGVEFSQDGSKLYTSYFEPTGGIYQFDLSSGNIATIKNSAILMVDEKGFPPGALQMGPDGRIYSAKQVSPYLHVIEFPDRPYPQCNLKLDAVYLDFDNTGRKCQLGLPNAINAIFFVKAKPTASNPACEGDTVFLNANVDASANGYTVHWSGPNGFVSNSEDTMIVNATKSITGWYYVDVTLGGKTVRDSVYVLVADSPFTTIKTSSATTFCQGDSIMLTAEPFNPSLFYKWSTGENTENITVRQTGRIYLNVKNAGNCEFNDSIDITVIPPPVVKIVPKSRTNFCEGDSVVLEASPFDPNVDYLWSTGETTQFIIVKTPGIIKLIGTNKTNCTDSTEILIDVMAVPVANITEGANISICIGDSTKLTAEPSGLNYIWSTGSTAQSITVKTPGIYWVKVENNNECRDTAFTRLENYPESTIEIRGNTNICKGDSTLLTGFGNFKDYLWSTGETTGSIYAKTKGKISLKATDYYGCVSYDTVDIDVFELKVDDNELKDIGFGRVFIDKDSVITVRIYNRDAASFVVSDIRFTNNTIFNHVNSLPETVIAGGYIDVKIKFSPADIITYKDSIQVIITDPCKITLTGNVSGTGIVKLIASLPDTTGDIGDIDFCIPLSAYLETNRNITDKSSWTAYISHDAALFAPKASISSSIINGIRYSTMQGNSTVQNSQKAISDYCGMILLDQKNSTVLELDSLNYLNPNVLVELKNGSLTTNGICVRNLSQIVKLEKIQLKLMKNPADDKIIFEVSIPNSENISIQLYNFAGIEERQSSITRRFEKGSFRIEIDTEPLVDGIYFIRLSTLDDVITEKIILYKR